MSTAWQTRHRLLLEQLEQLADWLGAQQPREQMVVEEQTARLLMGVVRLLRQHGVNQRGQCRFCRWTRWGRRIWRRRPRCTVSCALDFAMTQPMDAAWWQLLNDTGRDVGLDEVREWLKQREQAARELTVDDSEGSLA